MFKLGLILKLKRRLDLNGTCRLWLPLVKWAEAYWEVIVKLDGFQIKVEIDRLLCKTWNQVKVVGPAFCLPFQIGFGIHSRLGVFFWLKCFPIALGFCLLLRVVVGFITFVLVGLVVGDYQPTLLLIKWVLHEDFNVCNNWEKEEGESTKRNKVFLFCYYFPFW